MLLNFCGDVCFASRSISKRAALIVTWLMVFAAGCGSHGPVRVPIRGEVTVDGTRLKAGVIRFMPAGQTTGPVAVATIRDGLYEFSAPEAPVVGSHRVEIEAIDYFGFSLDDERSFAEHVEKGRRPMPPNPIHENYNRRSTLTAEVRLDGNHKFDFSLSRDPRNSTRRSSSGASN